VQLPAKLAHILAAPERFSRLDNNEALVRDFIAQNARATRKGARA
jgi:hypothetical protein